MPHPLRSTSLLALLLCGLLSTPGAAQGQNPESPPFAPESPWVTPTAGSQYIYELPEDEIDRALPQLYVPKRHTGVIQNIRHSTTLISAGPDELRTVEFDFGATFGFPLMTPASPLLITPSVGFDDLDNNGFDLPDGFYDASLEIRHVRPFGPAWTGDFAIKPGIFGNTETSASEFRFQARATAIYQFHDTLKGVIGFAYLDRADILALPVAGVIWHPNDVWKVDLVFPSPKIAWRGYRDCHSAWWVYVAGEFGGGTWGITRASGVEETATIRDTRLRIGLEREAHWVKLFLEAGIVFSRSLEYESGVGDTDLANAGLFRAGIYY